MASSDLSSYDTSKIEDIKGLKIGIVTARWNAEITNDLEKGAIATLEEHGILSKDLFLWEVPGSFELVYGAKKMSEVLTLDAIIVIGSVIRGETEHFDFVCQGVTQGIKDLNIQGAVPVIFCVLTDNNEAQAKARSGGKLGNKGVEAAVAAIAMARLGK